ALPVCAQPGMIVLPLGQVTPDKTPDSLIDDLLATTNGAKAVSDRANVNNTGRSLIFTAPCTDGSLRQTLVVTYIAFGRSYRITAFAPQAAFSQWAAVFQQLVASFSPGITSQGSSGQAVKTIAQAPRAYIAHIFAGNVYIGTLDDLPGAPITTDAAGPHRYLRAVFSHTGDQVIYIEQTADGTYIDRASVGHTGQRIVQSKPSATVLAQYPVVWSPDNKKLAYVVHDGDTANGGPSDFVIVAALDGKEDHRIALPVSETGPCTEDSADPANQAYWRDTAPCGNPGLLAWLSDGTILFSSTSGNGVGKIPPGGSAPKTVIAKLRRTSVSPVGKELAGLLDDERGIPHLEQVKISDGSTTEIPTQATPEQVVWNTNGAALFYSTAVEKQTLTIDDPTLAERAKAQLGVFPFRTTVYTIGLHRIDVRTKEDIALFQGDGRVIDYIAPSPDGAGVLFTVVQSGAAVVDAFKNNTSPSDLRRQYPVVQLYWLSLPTPNSQLVAITSNPDWGPILP
ncbi:MAG TPA: hypothetical protein VMT34_09195, partial [Aggregatilineales bacterium]|nr:hypothetical protein [Aggregatilineales bacterium]